MNNLEKIMNSSVDNIPEEYDYVLKNLIEKGKLECAFLLRLIWEAGLRPMDALDLKPSEMIGRTIHRKSLKNGKYEKYHMISEETEMIAAELLKRQGMFFSKSRQYYFKSIKRNFRDQNMSIWTIVKYSRNKIFKFSVFHIEDLPDIKFLPG